MADTIVKFDVVRERENLRKLESERDDVFARFDDAVANGDMATVLSLMGRRQELPGLIETLAAKIAKETGEEVATRKATVSAEFKVWVQNSFTRTPEFQLRVSELKQVNPKLRQIVIEFTDSGEPLVNLLGGYRNPTPSSGGKITRTHARYWNESLGKDEQGNPRTMGTQDIILAYGAKYWAQVFGPDVPLVTVYADITAAQRTKLAEAIVTGENLQNLAVSSTNGQHESPEEDDED